MSRSKPWWGGWEDIKYTLINVWNQKIFSLNDNENPTYKNSRLGRSESRATLLHMRGYLLWELFNQKDWGTRTQGKHGRKYFQYKTVGAGFLRRPQPREEEAKSPCCAAPGCLCPSWPCAGAPWCPWSAACSRRRCPRSRGAAARSPASPLHSWNSCNRDSLYLGESLGRRAFSSHGLQTAITFWA